MALYQLFVDGRAAAASKFDVLITKNPFTPTLPNAKLVSLDNVITSGVSFVYPCCPNCCVLAYLDFHS